MKTHFIPAWDAFTETEVGRKMLADNPDKAGLIASAFKLGMDAAYKDNSMPVDPNSHTIADAPMPQTPPIPRICGTCRKREPESGYCIMWCMVTDSTYTCKHWKLESDEADE